VRAGACAYPGNQHKFWRAHQARRSSPPAVGSSPLDTTTAFAEEAAANAMLSATSDRAEGVTALLEGRRPKFTGH
jgi:hypothetical protein